MSISATSRREEKYITKREGWAAGGSKEEDSASESDFYITFQGPEEHVFSLLEAVPGKRRTGGEACCRNVEDRYQNRFSVKLTEKKLKEKKMDNHPFQENCHETKAPLHNKEIVGKGNLDRATRKLTSE